MRNWKDLIEAGFAEGKLLCVGLDPDSKKIPSHLKAGDTDDLSAALEFCTRIVDATKHLALAYKPNAAFFVKPGFVAGSQALRELIRRINQAAPGVPVILDSKRGDIGNSMKGYVEEAFDVLGADAMTASPYLGQDACQPLLDRTDNGAIFLCKTSNPGSGETQNVQVRVTKEMLEWIAQGRPVDDKVLSLPDHIPYYQYIAYLVSSRRKWNINGNCALVVGATYPDELQQVRRIVGAMPILIPGIGTQGGDEEATIAAGRDSRERGMIINVGSAVLYASAGEDFAQAALAKAEHYHQRFLSLATA